MSKSLSQNMPSFVTGNNTLISTIDLTQTPSRSGTSSPSLEIELTPEQSANLGEIDFNTGLDGFLLAALKNPKDRLFLLKLDREMERFINDNHTRLEFPPMNSYQRLIVHRVAQYFKLSHVVDNSGKAVILYKSPETLIPTLRFSDLLEQEEEKPEKSVKIMRRQQTNLQLLRSTGDSDSNSEGERRILTIEEREAAYQKARARIFKDLEQKNEENEREEIEGNITSSSNPSSTNVSNISNNNDQQNFDSNIKTKNTHQNKGNNKNSGKNNANNVKNRQSQSSRVQQNFNYNPPIDRPIYMKGRPINNFPGPPPMMPPGPFGPPFFNGPPHMNIYDNMMPLQPPPMLPPEMQIGHPMNNPYANVPHEWNPTLAGPYPRPGVRNLWGAETFNPPPPPEIGGGPSLFINSINSINSMDNKSNKSPLIHEGTTTSSGSSMNNSVFDGNNSLWANKGQWNNNLSGVWNNSSDAPSMSIFNPSQQSSAEFPIQNVPGVPLMHPQMFPGMVPPPMSNPTNTGPRRNNNGNQMYLGPMHQEYINNMQRFGMVPPPMTGFPNQLPPTNVTGAIRPPKSTELFDPNNSSTFSTQNYTNNSLPTSNHVQLSSNSSRRKNVIDTSNNLNNNNPIVDGSMMRSLSISSNSSQQGKNHQLPYEGVKPSEANEPPQPSHIIELHDFVESDNLLDISLGNATIKRISPPQSSPNKRPTILAIFKNSHEATKA
ncbi:10788_t:CDS:2, partial [Diversispora eburnea]